MTYRERPELNISKLKELKPRINTPYEFWATHIAGIIKPKDMDKDCIRFGNALDAMILDNKIIHVEETRLDGRTKLGKEQEELLSSGNFAINGLWGWEYRLANRFVSALKEDETWLSLANEKYINKHQIFFKSNGLDCKAELDRSYEPSFLYPDGLIIDLKTTASMSVFEKNMYELGYYNQISYYQLAYYSVYNTFPECKWLILDKRTGKIYWRNVTKEILLLGATENDYLLKLYKRCIETNNWEDRPLVADAIIPTWKINQIMEDIQ